MQKSGLLWILSIVSIFILWSCQSEGTKVRIPDTSSIDVSDVNFVRYDRVVEEMQAEKVKSSYLETVREYPIFTDLYFKRILNIPFENQDSFYFHVASFLQAEKIQKLQDTINVIYGNTEDVEDGFRKAFGFLKYYFPYYTLPDVYFFQSEFGYQTIIFQDQNKDGVAVGLDMFLGNDFNYKRIDPRNPSFSEYLSRTYNKEHIVRKTLDMMINDLIGDPNGKRFIDRIIHEGKKLYILDHLLPEVSDTIVFEYSEDQLNWLKNNELEVWSYFLEKELIYETNHLKIEKYVSPSPNSPGMPDEAPGRTGAYIGYRIVDAYMQKYGDGNMKTLIEAIDAQKIMELSKYKPKRR